MRLEYFQRQVDMVELMHIKILLLNLELGLSITINKAPTAHRNTVRNQNSDKLI